MIIEKYTPKIWNEVVGQNIILNLKDNIIKNKIYFKNLIFFGPKGVGKHTCAKILINEINKFDFEKSNFCELNYSNIFEVDGLFKITTDDLHHIVKLSNFFFKKKKKYYIIFNNIKNFSQYILNFFFNFIIKKYKNIFFIICEDKQKYIPDYILLNSQIYNFKKISSKDIYCHIKMISKKENIKIENESLLIISKYVNGSIGKAILIIKKLIDKYNLSSISKKNFITQQLGIIDFNFFFEFINYFLNKELQKILISIDQIIYKKISFYSLIFGLKDHFKKLFFYKKNNTLIIETLDNKKYIQQSNKISFCILNSTLSLFYNLENELYDSNDTKLTIEKYLIKIYNFFNNYKTINDVDNLFTKNFLNRILKNFIIENNDILNVLDINKYILIQSFYNKKIKLIIPHKIKKKNIPIIKKKLETYLNNIMKDFLYEIVQEKSEVDKEKFIKLLVNKLNLKKICSNDIYKLL